MMNYVLVYLLRVKYGLQVYISREIVSKLEEFFQNVSELPVAEEELCGYERFFKELQRQMSGLTTEYLMSETNKRRNTPGLLTQSPETEAVSIVNSRSYYEQKVDMKSKQLANWSSFPWEDYNDYFSQLESPHIQHGRAFILYPFGLSLYKIDGFGKYENHHIEDVPGLMDFTLNSFVFKKDFRDTSHTILSAIAQAFRRQNPRKFQKRQDITFVGVHHRRGDHIGLQRESKMDLLGPGYFLDAMAMFRQKFRRVAFVYVSDDMKWAEEKLLPRIKTKDFYLAGLLKVSLVRIEGVRKQFKNHE